MATGRNPKRARKKDRRAARREEWMREYRRRRRQRRIVYLIGLAVLVVIGLGVYFFVLAKPTKKHLAASPSPQATAQHAAASRNVVACGGKVPAAASQKKQTYSEAEDQSLDTSKIYTWKLLTSCGEIDINLDVTDSPKTANSIVFLTRQGFYDGLIFHRIAPDFVIQGGDPKGDGTGGPGFKVVDPVPSTFKYTKGTVAMAKAGNEAGGTSGSQFFIVTSSTGAGQLTPDYAVVGNVSAGQDVVDKIAATGTADGSPPTAWTYIDKATIEVSG